MEVHLSGGQRHVALLYQMVCYTEPSGKLLETGKGQAVSKNSRSSDWMKCWPIRSTNCITIKALMVLRFALPSMKKYSPLLMWLMPSASTLLLSDFWAVASHTHRHTHTKPQCFRHRYIAWSLAKWSPAASQGWKTRLHVNIIVASICWTTVCHMSFKGTYMSVSTFCFCSNAGQKNQ